MLLKTLLGQLDREKALYTFSFKRSNLTKNAWAFLKCYKLSQLSEPSRIWKTTKDVTMWALKESGKTSFIVQWQTQRACQQLQTQYFTNSAAEATPPTPKRNGHAANTKPDTHTNKPEWLCPVIAIIIIFLPIAGNVDFVDMGWIVFFQVRRLMALWLFIVGSDNAILATD